MQPRNLHVIPEVLHYISKEKIELDNFSKTEAQLQTRSTSHQM